MTDDLQLFSETVWEYYRTNSRELLWRTPESDGIFDPYKIMVSEIMLQQTQVSRVTTKYMEFLDRFPTVVTLAASSFSDVLLVWSGLGYNRRAKFLLAAAQAIMNEYDGMFPRSAKELETLPGIGKNTAAAIRVYAFNYPDVFIETNIRSVYIHHFFKDREKVTDKELLPIIEASIDRDNPREWYWALMDYGTYIKATHGNASRSSANYKKQSVFEGSRRQLRARILRSLLEGPKQLDYFLENYDDERLDSVLEDLERESLIVRINKRFTLA